jgi:hypothetical protein
MGMTTLRQQEPDRAAAVTYWRRRFIALVTGLSVLALAAWALSSALGGPGPAAGGGAARLTHGTLPSAAATGGSGTAGQHGTGTGGHAAQHQGGSGSGAGGMRPCPPNDVVLSLFSSQAAYSLRQAPEFEVDVVSTAGRSCTFNIGARHLWVQITAGSLRVWSSDECAEGEASLVTELQRGVPTVVPIGWDGQISSQGCPGPGTMAPAGVYTAVASDSTSSSNTLAFRIG